MACMGAQTQSPGRTFVPSDRLKGIRAARREVTVKNQPCGSTTYVCMYLNSVLESAGDIRADSLMKLSSSGRP